MAVYIECPGCRYRNGLGAAKKRENTCRCGKKLPQHRRVYWIGITLKGRKEKIKRLGTVSYDWARDQEYLLRKSVKTGEYYKQYEVLTWGALRKKYIKEVEIEGRSAKYVRNGNYWLMQFGEYWGDDIRIDKITPAMITEFRLTLLEKGKLKSTCDSYLAAGGAAWNRCAPDTKNPFREVKLFRPDNRITRWLSDDELAAVLKGALEISRDIFEIIMVARGTALRRGNVLNLKRSEVDFEMKTISVTQKKNRSLTILMNDDIFNILKNIPNNGTLYFWTDTNGLPYTGDRCETLWRKVKRRAGIKKRLRFHDLRHDAGTRIYANTKDIRATQQYLGHAKLETTLRYAHVFPDYQIKAANALKIKPTTELSKVEKDNNNK